jgi:predicted  nucleic acid-binding Zn-ribbon protein
VNKNLELLISLQDIDIEIGKLEDNSNKIPQEIDQLYRACQQIKDEIGRIKKNIDLHNKERREKERGVEIENDHISKAKVKLSQVKTNEEYSALLKEIDSVKDKIKKMEDEDLCLMELIDEEQKTLKEKEKLLKEEEKRFQEVKGEKERDIESLKKNIEEKRVQRESIRVSLDNKILQDYIKVSRNREGIAVVRFSDGICQGCFLGLPPQLASEIRKNEEIIKCPHCQRVLYWIG